LVPTHSLLLGGRSLPWYWTDEITDALVLMGRLDEPSSGSVPAMPIAIRRAESMLEGAAMGLQEDDAA
ncbi:MAG: hypothetical protein O6951_09225, partial [Actinobacteria bacterium]|nr:hypothetical protein [Actinomycetota bacterium]